MFELNMTPRNVFSLNQSASFAGVSKTYYKMFYFILRHRFMIMVAVGKNRTVK